MGARGQASASVGSAVAVFLAAVSPVGSAQASAPDNVSVTPPVAPRQSGRVRVPVGCDRLVSALVKAASADRVGRCIT